MKQNKLEQFTDDRILFEDNHLIVVNKPAGIATMGTAADDKSLVDLIREYIKKKYNKPGNVYLGVVSRIDMFVSGVLVFAKTSKAASRLSEQFRKSTVQKQYVAVLEETPQLDLEPRAEGAEYFQLQSWLRKNDRLKKVESFSREVKGAKLGQLEFRIIRNQGSFCLVRINLITGRKHQIRAQFSDLGCPVFGDRKYGGSQEFQNQIALHAYSIELTHPTLKSKMRFAANPPETWRKNGRISALLD